MYAASYGPNRIPFIGGHALHAGKGIHACIQKALEYLQDTQGETLEQDMVATIVEEVMATDKQVPTLVYNDVFFAFNAWAKRYKHDFERFLGAETFLSREMPSENAVIIGYLDNISRRTDDKGDIIVSKDYKTGWKAELSASHTFQGEIATWMMRPVFPNDRVGYSVEFTRKDVESETFELHPAAEARIEAHIRTVIYRIRDAKQKRRYPATPGSWCAWCPIAARCRERNVLVENQVIVADKASAERAAADLLIIEAARNQRIEQLKPFIETEGPLRIQDSELGFHDSKPSPKIDDARALVETLGRHEAFMRSFIPDESTTLDTLEPEQRNIVLALGLEVALKSKLLTVNGNVTKSKKIQSDERLLRLWRPSRPKTSFNFVEVGAVKLEDDAPEDDA